MSFDTRPPAGKPAPTDTLPVWAIGLAGAAALAVAMGIGRFVFTPLLPLMQREGLIDADGGALLAAANYLGYLVGALSAARVPVAPRTLVLGALLGTALLTAATGALQGLTAWWALRFMAGVMSAWALVGVGAWAVPMLAQRGRADAAGAVFAGVGLGIALAGGWVWALSAQPAAALWWQMGGLALVLAGLVAGLWPGASSGAAPARA
ncbi:MAG: YbfB/YjiJ family MFS transporter, partial [Aquabacterium sp.]